MTTGDSFITTITSNISKVLVFILFANCIPIVYYRSQQGFDPYNREPLWHTWTRNFILHLYFLVSMIYKFLSQTIAEHDHIEGYCDDTFNAFSKRNIRIVITNRSEDIMRAWRYHLETVHSSKSRLDQVKSKSLFEFLSQRLHNTNKFRNSGLI